MHARQVKDASVSVKDMTLSPECHHKRLVIVGLARPVLETFI